jgi:OFA family oxalate/formate antiporter-like MFS transporter
MRNNKKWFMALSTIAIHISIGSVYAYSVFKAPLSEQVGWDSQKVALAFTIAIFFLGITAAFFGKHIERLGPRKSGMIAAVLFCGGLAVAGWGVTIGSLYGFYLGYGVIGGIGLGVGYLAPVSTLVSWFPDRRGLATGMAVMGFGMGAFAAGPIAAHFIETIGIAKTLFSMSIVYFIIMMAGASYLERPRSYQETVSDNKQAVTVEFTASSALKSSRFWMLWTMFFINITCGIMLISAASPMAQEQVGMSAAGAATMVGIMGLFNGAGRLGWSALSDKVGRPNIFSAFFSVTFIAFLLLPQLSSPMLFQLFIFLIISFYGGGFAISPAFIGDMFGTKHMGVILGYLLTAWSMAGIVGPTVAAYIYEQTSSYELTFYLFAILLIVAFGLSFLIRRSLLPKGVTLTFLKKEGQV